MTLPHLLNILVHVLAGTAAIVLGLYVLRTQQNRPRHRRLGRLYVALTLVVCLTAVVGNAVFRFMPLFAVLTLLVSYQLLSGWHVIYTRGKGPDIIDAALLLGGTAVAATLTKQLLFASAMAHTSKAVVMSTIVAVAVILVYDAARWMFPKYWHAALWRYEHIFKVVNSLFAMLAAAVGNTVPAGQPWSQLAPSAVGTAVIVWCWIRNYRAQQGVVVSVPITATGGET